MLNRHLISAIRFGLSISLSFFAAKYFAFQNPYWAPTTIIIVEGINYGSFSGKIIPRFMGNLVGAVIGLGIIAVFLQIPVLYSLVISIFTGVLVFQVLEDKNPLFWRWVLIAALIITSYNIDTPNNAFHMGMDRVACVSLGLLINFLFHQLFYFRSAHMDFLNDVQDIINRLHIIAEKKAANLKLNIFSPIKEAEEIFPMIKLLHLELENASRDSKKIHDNKIVYEKLLELIEDTASSLVYLAIEKEKTGYLDSDADKISFYLVKAVQELKKINIASFFSENLKYTEEREIQLPSKDDNFSVLTAFAALSKTQEIKQLLSDGKIKKPLKEKVNPNKHNNFITSLLSGTALFTGMMVWRTTGWPGGMMIPLLSMLFILYYQMLPDVTIKLLIILQVVSLTGAMGISFFILPVIHSTEFFFIFITILYTIFGLLMHSPKTGLRGVGMLLAVLVNSCVYGYKATLMSFNIMSTYALLIIGGDLIAILLIQIFHRDDSMENFRKASKEIITILLKSEKGTHGIDAHEISARTSLMEGLYQYTIAGIDREKKYHVSMLMYSAQTLETLVNSHSLSNSQETAIQENMLFHLKPLFPADFKVLKNEI